jgi:hypothetical protein
VGEWTFRVLGEPFPLEPDEQGEVAAEIARLRALISSRPEHRLVRVNQNPAGLVGEYASLLMEATVRGRPAEDVLPADIRRRYGGCHWFGVSLDVLGAFREQWEAVLAERDGAATEQRRRWQRRS